MKTTVKIPKSRLTAPVDYGAVISERRVCGVILSYTELDFICIEGGRIVIFDAYSAAHKFDALEANCGAIAFPFCLSCTTDSGERVAYCGLRFGENKPVRFEPVIPSGRIVSLALGDAANIPIASGVCCIASSAAYVEYRKHINDEPHPLAGVVELDGFVRALVRLYGKQYAVFSSGWGDGRYPCYIGYDEAGAVATVIVDFGMIEYPRKTEEYVEVEVDADMRGVYVYDPTKSERENNIARWTSVLETETDPTVRMHAYSRRGYSYHSANDLDSALADYNAAIECSKRVTDRGELLRAWSVYDNTAEIYCMRGDYESAIDVLNAALAVGDDFYSGAYVRLIDLYRYVKRDGLALDIAKRMLAARPLDPVANVKYAECCEAVTDYGAAAIAYRRLADEFRLYENYFDEAECLIKLGDLDGAAAALERHPAKEFYEHYWQGRADIEFKRKKFRAALELAEKARSINREFLPPLYVLIDAESILQEHHAACSYAEEYKRLRPDNEYGYGICAEEQLLLGNFSECARNYFRLYEIKGYDKYAALAAVVCARAGEKKRGSSLLRMLKRKHSPYYYGAVCGRYEKKFGISVNALQKVISKIRDDDFLLQLAVFFDAVGSPEKSRIILDALSGRGVCSPELVAQHLRTAEHLGDKAEFLRRFEFYTQNYTDKMTVPEKQKFAERFMSNPARHKSWVFGMSGGASKK